MKAKLEGRTIEKPKERKPEKVIDLMAALRESAKASKKTAASGRKKAARGGSGEAQRRKAS